MKKVKEIGALFLCSAMLIMSACGNTLSSQGNSSSAVSGGNTSSEVSSAVSSGNTSSAVSSVISSAEDNKENKTEQMSDSSTSSSSTAASNDIVEPSTVLADGMYTTYARHLDPKRENYIAVTKAEIKDGVLTIDASLEKSNGDSILDSIFFPYETRKIEVADDLAIMHEIGGVDGAIPDTIDIFNGWYTGDEFIGPPAISIVIKDGKVSKIIAFS